MFAVCATFIIKQGEINKFIEAVKIDAASSVELEAGCHRFDVCQSRDNPLEVFLYEVYDDEAAFAVHKTMPHYAEFGAVSADLVETLSVKTYSITNA